MSDRRPSKLYDPKAATLWWNAEGRHLSIVELHEAVTDPVAVVCREVESGKIEGEVVEASYDDDWLASDYSLPVSKSGTYVVVGPVSLNEQKTED